MEDKIKDLICRIHQLESEEPSIGGDLELKKLYAKLRDNDFVCDKRLRQWKPHEGKRYE
jgi:uncharacterized protein (UPF0335 family)